MKPSESKLNCGDTGARTLLLLALLFLSAAFAAQVTIKADYSEYYYPDKIVGNFSDMVMQSIPAEVKSFIAGVIRLTADEYMHIGPTKKVKQNFVAGAFAGNTELTAMLGLGLIFEPSHIESYVDMSHNMAIYLHHFSDAIQLIQRGILVNKNSPELHKLYSAGAFCYGFYKKYTNSSPERVRRCRTIAINYLNKAIEAYLKSESQLTPDLEDTFANIENYYVMKCRFLIDTGRIAEAMQVWELIPVNRREGLISFYFDLASNGVKVPALPEDLLEPEYKAFIQQTLLKAPYSLPDEWKNWLCSGEDLYQMWVSAHGWGAFTLDMDDCIHAGDLDEQVSDKYVMATDCGHDHHHEEHEHEHECSDPNCTHHHHEEHEHEHECSDPNCTHHHHEEHEHEHECSDPNCTHHHHENECSDPDCAFCASAKAHTSMKNVVWVRSGIMLLLSLVLLGLSALPGRKQKL